MDGEETLASCLEDTIRGTNNKIGYSLYLFEKRDVLKIQESDRITPKNVPGDWALE